MSIYRYGSELLHGTYFGVVHYWRGSQSEEISVSGFEKVWLEHFVGVFSAAFFGAAGVVEASAAKFDLPTLKKEQHALIKRTKALIAD
ncbi:MAG: hypothetical protein JSR89_01590 [Proteobacteria bacterium]|nr:hypothetical protein [Pseudomonadota bacterium]